MKTDIKEFGEIYTNKHELWPVQRPTVKSVLLVVFFTINNFATVSHVRYTLRITEDVDYIQKYVSGKQGCAFLHSANCNDARPTRLQDWFHM
jgi:hypothetical protein